MPSRGLVDHAEVVSLKGDSYSTGSTTETSAVSPRPRPTTKDEDFGWFKVHPEHSGHDRAGIDAAIG